MMEKERLAVEAEYQRKEQARREYEEAERQARVTRQREMEVARLQSQGFPVEEARAVVDAGNDASIPPAVIGGAFAAYAAVAWSSSPGRRERERNEGTANATNQSLSPVVDRLGNTTTDSAAWDPTGSSTDVGMLSDVERIDRLSTPPTMSRNAASSLYSKPMKSNEERKEHAQKAMEKYLDQNDIGEAWLQVMADIIDESDYEDNGDKDETDVFLNGSNNVTNFGRINGGSEKRL